jgi:hypothetical protein
MANLDTSLLLKVMSALGEFHGNPTYPLETGALMHLVPTEIGSGSGRLDHLDRHVDFLRDVGLLKARPAGIYRALELTAKGQMFLQPELAEFGQRAMLPQVVKSLEDKIQVLTYPQEEKDRMLYRLREAIARQTPEVIAKVIAEIGAKILAGGN